MMQAGLMFEKSNGMPAPRSKVAAECEGAALKKGPRTFESANKKEGALLLLLLLTPAAGLDSGEGAVCE